MNDFLECRDFMHAWKAHTVERESGGFRETLRCSRCGTFKVRILNRWGYIIKSHHGPYPDGYLRPKGEGRMTKKDRAQARLQRLAS